jgi:hypothetical protein
VSIRFTGDEYERLRHIADYRGISVTILLHYVITNGVLPRLEREMRKEQEHEQPTTLSMPQAETPIQPPDWLHAGLDGATS